MNKIWNLSPYFKRPYNWLFKASWWSWPEQNYELCFTANIDWSTITLTKEFSPTAVSLEKSTDRETRTSYSIGSTITLDKIWDRVYFRNTSETDTWFSSGNYDYYKFVMSWSISASWDLTYLLNKNGTSTLSSRCFTKLFYWCSSLTTAPEISATTLANNCCYYMFRDCTNLIKSMDVLPAETLASSCYEGMFYWCSNLSNSPKFLATTLWDNCCTDMFRNCINLETLPELLSITLTWYCYNNMFRWCSKIKLSTTQTWEYQTPYRIPATWTGKNGNMSLYQMFNETWGTFSGTPSVNKTYYTSNTIISSTIIS